MPLPTVCCRVLHTLFVSLATVSIPTPCSPSSPEALRVKEAELQGLCQLSVHQAVPQEGSTPAHGGLQLGGEGVNTALPHQPAPHTPPPPPMQWEGGPQGQGCGVIGIPEERKPL